MTTFLWVLLTMAGATIAWLGLRASTLEVQLHTTTDLLHRTIAENRELSLTLEASRQLIYHIPEPQPPTIEGVMAGSWISTFDHNPRRFPNSLEGTVYRNRAI